MLTHSRHASVAYYFLSFMEAEDTERTCGAWELMKSLRHANDNGINTLCPYSPQQEGVKPWIQRMRSREVSTGMKRMKSREVSVRIQRMRSREESTGIQRMKSTEESVKIQRMRSREVSAGIQRMKSREESGAELLQGYLGEFARRMDTATAGKCHIRIWDTLWQNATFQISAWQTKIHQNIKGVHSNSKIPTLLTFFIFYLLLDVVI